MPAQKKEVAAVHTLLTREIRPIRNWHEWLALWQAADNLQWMESLLHVGFGISLERAQYGEQEYSGFDRVMFYLTIADGWGWTGRHSLELPTDGDAKYRVGYDSNWHLVEKSARELRQQLARKAFDMLCLNFFKVELTEEVRGRFNGFWERLVASERLLPATQHFFRAEKDRYGDDVRIRNLSGRDERSHNEQQAVNFLLNLARFLWMRREPELRYYSDEKRAEAEEERKRLAETRARVDAAKPWMVEILVALDKLDMLQEWIFQLDEACLAKLKEIALRNKLSRYQHPVMEDRPVATLDEARYLGSSAAWFLARHEVMTREHKRLEAICDAKRTKAEADRKIEKLTAKA
ncbi:MAG: hypothetical protein HYS43_01465 [Candidatus Liptonbacteria bacterium]|nr:hypothetical protein [Candidatus Liptonbacteria bacterium]